jgi:hypothetical protein
VEPSVARVQLCDSIMVPVPHAPPPQAYTVQVRIWDPVVAQSSGYEHAPHAPQVVAPQLVPSVSRVQLSFSVRSLPEHEPAAQT